LGRLGAVAILKLVTENHARPIRNGEAEFCEGLAIIEMQILVQVELRRWHRRETTWTKRIVRSSIIVVVAELLHSKAGESKIILPHVKRDFVIVRERVAFNKERDAIREL